MQKEWATGVSGNPKNFGVKIIDLYNMRKPKRTLMRASLSGDGRRVNALIASKNRQSIQRRPSGGMISFGSKTLLRHSP